MGRKANPAIDPREDLVHTPRDEPLWRESYYWDLCDVESELMVYATFGKRPFKGRSGFLTAIWDGAAGALLAGQDVDTFAEHTDEHRIAGLGLECIEPFRRWRLWYDGRLVRCPRAGERRFAEPRHIPRAERELVPVSFEVELECVGEPCAYEASEGFAATFDGHHEQVTLASGVLSVDGAERTLTALPGIRDHSWGTRDWHGIVDSRWIACVFEDEDAPHVSLMKQTRADGTEVLDGAVYRGGVASRIVGYAEEAVYDAAAAHRPGATGGPGARAPGWSPPEARALRFAVETEDGERLDVSTEVRAMLPITFERDGRVNWNDRSFAAFEAEGRKGFGCVEFNSVS